MTLVTVNNKLKMLGFCGFYEPEWFWAEIRAKRKSQPKMNSRRIILVMLGVGEEEGGYSSLEMHG